jgi:predicted transcriptional regulator
MNLRSHRNTLGISQSRLARLSRVSRFKICLYELGDGRLNPEEQTRIRLALQAEAERLRSIPNGMDIGELSFKAEATSPNQGRPNRIGNQS